MQHEGYLYSFNDLFAPSSKRVTLNFSINVSDQIATNTAKANGLEPYAYLWHLFTELPKAETVEAIEMLLPGNAKKF